MNSSLPHSASPQKLSPSLENSTIQKQRQELQLLIAELKDRDKELNDMVAVHQRQLLAWEDDRQKILTLAERCNLLNNELNKRNEIIKSLTKKLKFLESQQNDNKTTLENTQQKFKELSQKATDASLHCQALEEKNQSLHCSVLELSAKTGQLQAREQELLTMLKLKDEVILETTDHITEFTSKFKKLESALRVAKTEEFSLNKEKQDLRLRLKDLILETNKLKDDLCEKMKENNKQQEEILHLRQENSCLRNELALSVEKAKRKDQLLQSAKSKQARTDAELSSLRQIYVKQQRDLQFLHVNLESSQELRQKHEKVAHERSIGMAFPASESNSKTDSVRTEGTHGTSEECGTAQVPNSRVKTTSEVCEVDNRLLLNASDLEETTSAYLNRCQKVVKVLAVLREEEEKQDVASSSDELGSKVFCEANNSRPLRNRDISENGVESRDQQTFESSLPEYEHWLNVSSCVDSQSTLIQNTITFDKTDDENKTWEEGTGILFGQKSREIPAAIHKSESDSCSNNFIIKKDARWKRISDPEWLKIFKPIKGDGSIWHGKDCSCLKTAQEMKCASSKSEENVDLNSFHLDSPCLTSTQKGDRPQRCEKFSDEDFLLEINNLSVTKPTSRCCSATMDQDTGSPISKLQHALAESRQMVADLELSTLLHANPRCSPNSSSINMTAELAEALHRSQLSAAEGRDAKLPFFSL
ncbi:coiled-coil domain-containing protein 62 isoform X1 [Grus americana]|uniref:coiled-coil domain-containing protein 62 isoform X1 n=1 Tax=Grus americana TaxID=9117 RepID=UPI002407894F|nr:coiled-coil domain-containing protein 62 isoform X1 [Grus americana]XP_054700507.1 coiled-coil domain-containing protein 62 isoform X1 [Grus americana]XP_054700508.1 coiled-coil domain-containing protein 62 isoform X1 [Grus americana]XP_054700509.1 coiled-coil domain-containing protein 62 isoform X1 [Grus americana]